MSTITALLLNSKWLNILTSIRWFAGRVQFQLEAADSCRRAEDQHEGPAECPPQEDRHNSSVQIQAEPLSASTSKERYFL